MAKNELIIWIKKNKFSFFFLIITLLLGAFLRLYRISDYATFLGDEGRDVIVVRDMLLNNKWTLLGPTASFGNLYLGPIYYYFMLPALWLSNFDPTGPAAMVATIGILTIFLIWKTSLEFFNEKAAIVSSLLYAVSPLVISHTRSSWNPNPVPFFALLAFYSLFKSLKSQNFKWLFITGVSLGIALQLHYITMVLLGLIFLATVILLWKKNLKWITAEIFGFLLGLSPQIVFEVRHNFVNLKALFDFFLKRGEFQAAAGVGFDAFWPQSIFFRLFTKLIAVEQNIAGIILGLTCLVVMLYFLFKEKKIKSVNLGLFLATFWLVIGVFAITLYRGPIYDHYLGFLFPAPFLAFGFTFSKLWQQKYLRYLSIVILLVIVALSLNKVNYFSVKNGPNYQIQRTRQVAKWIADDVGNQKFNIALASATKDFMGLNYRYFLKTYGKEPQDYSNFDKIDTLYVIEEIKWVEPGQLNLWEVNTFGKYKIIKDWTFDFQVMIYRLDHE